MPGKVYSCVIQAGLEQLRKASHLSFLFLHSGVYFGYFSFPNKIFLISYPSTLLTISIFSKIIQ